MPPSRPAFQITSLPSTPVVENRVTDPPWPAKARTVLQYNSVSLPRSNPVQPNTQDVRNGILMNRIQLCVTRICLGFAVHLLESCHGTISRGGLFLSMIQLVYKHPMVVSGKHYAHFTILTAISLVSFTHHLLFWFANSIGAQSWPAAIMVFSEVKINDINGKLFVLTVIGAGPHCGEATDKLESWPLMVKGRKDEHTPLPAARKGSWIHTNPCNKVATWRKCTTVYPTTSRVWILSTYSTKG